MPSLAAPDHPPRHDAGHVQQPFDVRVDHPFPVVRVALVEVLETGRQSRIVDQQVHFPETVGQRAQRAFGLKTVPDVESQHMHFHAVLSFQFVVEFLQTVGAPPGDYPSRASARAVAVPIPEEAPVTKAVFSITAFY